MICHTAWERRERGTNSHELAVTFLSEEKELSRERATSRMHTDALFTFAVDIPLPPHCPPSTTGPNGALMTSSGVTRSQRGSNSA